MFGGDELTKPKISNKKISSEIKIFFKWKNRFF